LLGRTNSTHWGWLIAYHDDADQRWSVAETEMLSELALQLSVAIEQAEQLSQTQVALEWEKNLNAFKSQMVGTVSHEYRTPLTAILAAASTLRLHQHQLTQPQQQRCLEIIEERSRHMARLVEDLFIFNQAELGLLTFEPIQMDLLHFFSDLVEEQRPKLRPNQDLSLRISGNHKGFWGDRGLLRQIGLHLIGNALVYSPAGGQIEVDLIGQESQVILVVKDEGIGIAPTEQEQVFQAFQRGSNCGSIPGGGLGLTITQACVKSHKGTLTLTSQVGQGTQVKVCLPKQSI
jgi:signal transduction histidine kinase